MRDPGQSTQQASEGDEGGDGQLAHTTMMANKASSSSSLFGVEAWHGRRQASWQMMDGWVVDMSVRTCVCMWSASPPVKPVRQSVHPAPIIRVVDVVHIASRVWAASRTVRLQQDRHGKGSAVLLFSAPPVGATLCLFCRMRHHVTQLERGCRENKCQDQRHHALSLLRSLYHRKYVRCCLLPRPRPRPRPPFLSSAYGGDPLQEPVQEPIRCHPCALSMYLARYR